MTETSALMVDETSLARAELRSDGQYGGHQNAEDLIRAHFASISPEVRSGLRLGENPDALAAAKEADAGSQIQVPEGGRLLAWTVRGQDARRMVLSYVYEDAAGRAHHGIQGYSDDYEAPAESPSDRAVREAALHDARVKKEAGVAQADIDAKLEQFRVEQNEALAKRFASLQDELTKSLAAIMKGEEPSSSGGSKASKEEASSTAKKSGSTGESGTGDSTHAPKPDGSGSGSDEVKYPRDHAGLNELLAGSGKTPPEGWDDLKAPAKADWLAEHGVKPEAGS